jgi:hypothetical protein
LRAPLLAPLARVDALDFLGRLRVFAT